MKLCTHILIGFLLAVADHAPTSATRDLPRPLRGLSAGITVTEVYDGDTLTGTVTIPVRIRLLDCWAPELRGGTEASKELAKLSTDNLKQLAEGKRGTIWIPWEHAHRSDDVLTFGRVLAHVWINGQAKSVSQQQVESGFATAAKE